MTVPEALSPAPVGTSKTWEFLPFRFHRFERDSVLLTNLVGEHTYLTSDAFAALMDGSCTDEGTLARLRALHIIRHPDEQLPVALLGMKLRTRTRRLADATGLHIFVVTLRCEHSCTYCQVSRQTSDRDAYDMTQETADAGLRIAFQSPNPNLKIEFQGGEPLLNIDLIRYIVQRAQRLNQEHCKQLAFVIASNLALLDDSILAYCKANGVTLSTSLDGPQDLHTANRPRPGNDSWQRTVEGIRHAHDQLGRGSVSALMTTTERSLGRAVDIIDAYCALGLREVFLRPISPYGFALRKRSGAHYNVERWLDFYEQGLDRVIELNRLGQPMKEIYAAIILKKMLTNDDPGYVDLRSPAGIGLGALVYNYNGTVYASDEGRMLAENGDETFRLGHLGRDDYGAIMLADELLDPLEQSFTLSVPMCTTCAFEPFCGADPVFHHATAGNFVGQKAESAFCQRNMGVFSLLLRRYRDDEFARALFEQWANQ